MSSRSKGALLALTVALAVSCGRAEEPVPSGTLEQRLQHIFARCAERPITDVCLVTTPKELRGERFQVTSRRRSVIGGEELVLVFPDLGRKYLALVYDYGGGAWELRYIEERPGAIR